MLYKFKELLLLFLIISFIYKICVIWGYFFKFFVKNDFRLFFNCCIYLFIEYYVFFSLLI